MACTPVAATRARLDAEWHVQRDSRYSGVIPVSVSGAYSPLPGERDWTRKAGIQIRRSLVEIVGRRTKAAVTLRYSTVIRDCEAPDLG